MIQYFSKEGLEKIKQELDDREGRMRAEIAKRVLEAKDLGDLSENAEYAEAREAQSINEGRIEEIKEILRAAVVVDHPSAKGGIAVGSSIKIHSGKSERMFTIVGPTESNPSQGYISYESPIGAALLGHKKGDEVHIATPGGKVTYTIIEVK